MKRVLLAILGFSLALPFYLFEFATNVFKQVKIILTDVVLSVTRFVKPALKFLPFVANSAKFFGRTCLRSDQKNLATGYFKHRMSLCM